MTATRVTMQDEKEKRKAEVRARLEAQAKKKKRAFMTPQRKKCLRNLLRKKAAEELRIQQERKAEERRRIISERTGKAKSLEGKNEAALQAIIKDYHRKTSSLESEKYDIELAVRMKDFQIREITSKVNYYRGKFPVPALKKVSKTANQLEKIKLFTARVGALDYRSSLKQVAKKEYKLDDQKAGKDGSEKPEWVGRARSVASEPVSGAVSEYEEDEE